MNSLSLRNIVTLVGLLVGLELIAFQQVSYSQEPKKNSGEPTESSEDKDSRTPDVPADPVVARVEMKLALGQEVVDIIEKGDLLTVLEDRGDRYVIQTFKGRKGVVAKVNAVQLAESSEIYTQLIEASPEEGRLYTLRASAWWALGKQDKAVADFDKAIELGYDSAHAYSSRGLFLAAIGQLDKAVEDYTKAIEKEPSDETTVINRAAAYINLGKFDLAIADYDAVIKSKPDNAPFYQQRAIAKKLAGKLDEAIADFTITIEKDTESIPAFMGRGFLYFQQGKHEKAIEDFTKVIQLNPAASVAYNNRGFNLQQLGKDEEASADYSTAIRLAPVYGLAYQNRAWLLATSTNEKVRDPNEAVGAALKACQLSEYQNVSDIAALAAALASDGQFEKAVGWQEKVVAQADPTQKEYTQAILERYKSKQTFDPTLLKKLGAEGK